MDSVSCHRFNDRFITIGSSRICVGKHSWRTDNMFPDAYDGVLVVVESRAMAVATQPVT